ncbi:MAG: glycosyltransferase family 1 protein [Acidobacteriia bacterium]|nr:glycosyltransferase family 1 protein [Terriglobia bacterium]MBV8905739.1 glycosyltransferase family 1 protein [Terriglobia bacterium]
MRVRVITIGSQGDVRPCVALGVGLRNAGHDVRIVSHPGFEALVRENGLDFAPVAGDPREQANNPQLRALLDNGRNIFRWFRTFNEVDAPLMRQRLRDCWEACSDAEAIVVSVLPYLFGYAIARKLDVPLVRTFYFPTSPTRAYPAEFVPARLRLPGSLNLASYQLQRQVLWQVARPWVAGACRDILGLTSLPFQEPFSELDKKQQLLLYGYSSAVAPPPSDWGQWIDVTGYWFLGRSTDWTPPSALVAFLEGGPPPVCIGFGSMSNRDPARMMRVVTRALALAGQRAVVLTEWDGLNPAELPPEIFAIGRVPHDWLFPRVAVVVHHGGAGTTAIGLRAGLPTVVVPFFMDQFFWGRRVFDLGAGPRPLLSKNLDAESLAAALRLATTDNGMRARAAAVGERIRAEDGVARAVATFNRHMRFDINASSRAHAGRLHEKELTHGAN